MKPTTFFHMCTSEGLSMLQHHQTQDARTMFEYSMRLLLSSIHENQINEVDLSIPVVPVDLAVDVVLTDYLTSPDNSFEVYMKGLM